MIAFSQIKIIVLIHSFQCSFLNRLKSKVKQDNFEMCTSGPWIHVQPRIKKIPEYEIYTILLVLELAAQIKILAQLWFSLWQSGNLSARKAILQMLDTQNSRFSLREAASYASNLCAQTLPSQAHSLRVIKRDYHCQNST